MGFHDGEKEASVGTWAVIIMAFIVWALTIGLVIGVSVAAFKDIWS